MTKDAPKDEDGWVEVEQDPLHYDLIVVILACAMGLVIFLRQVDRMPEGAASLGMALTCTSFVLILVCFLVFMMWRMRQVRSGAIKRYVVHPWRRVAIGIEEVLDERDIEYKREVRRGRGPSYNWAFGSFRQVYHLPGWGLRIYVESRDAKGTSKGGLPTELSIGPVTEDNRTTVEGLTGSIDAVFSGWDDA